MNGSRRIQEDGLTPGEAMDSPRLWLRRLLVVVCGLVLSTCLGAGFSLLSCLQNGKEPAAISGTRIPVGELAAELEARLEREVLEAGR